jgi:hypothetical protein
MPRMCVETNDKQACTGSNATELPSDVLFGDLLGFTTNNSNEPPSTLRPEEPEGSGGTLPVAAVAGGGAAALVVIVVAIVGALIVKRRRDRKEMTQHDHARIHAKSAAEVGPSVQPSGSGGPSHAYAQIPFQGHGNLGVGGAATPSAYASSGHASSPYATSSGAVFGVVCMDAFSVCAVLYAWSCMHGWM